MRLKIGSIGATLLFLFVLYVASPPFVAPFVQDKDAVAKTIYWPLDWAINSTGTQDTYQRYFVWATGLIDHAPNRGIPQPAPMPTPSK